MDSNKPSPSDNSSLETSDSSQTTAIINESSDEGSDNPTNSGVVSHDSSSKLSEPKNSNPLIRMLDKINIYSILLVVVLFALGGASILAVLQSRKDNKNKSVQTQKLTQDAINKLSSTDSTVGDSTQTLTVESNAIFNGGVLVHGGLDVAGTLKIGGALTLPNLTVGGITTVEQLAAKSLTVAGDLAVQGKIIGQGGLAITGAGSFSGPVTASQITTGKLQLSSDLQLTRHITTNSGAPGHTNGNALGSGGTVSNSGTDTAGTITINTGNSAPAGCFINISFSAAYSTTPHVVISPSSATAASLDYYTNRTSAGFSMCTVSDPPDNTSGIIFDYIVIS